jgi:hypothetical protein
MARPPVDIIPNLQVLSTKSEGYLYIIKQLPAAIAADYGAGYRIWIPRRHRTAIEIACSVSVQKRLECFLLLSRVISPKRYELVFERGLNQGHLRGLQYPSL